MNPLDDVNSPDENHAPDSGAGGANYSRAGFGALGDVHIEHKPVTNVNITSTDGAPRLTQPIRFGANPDEQVDYSKVGMGAGGPVHIEHKPETTINQTTINHNGVPPSTAHGGLSWQVTLIVVCGILVAGFLLMRGQQPTVIQLPPLPVNDRPIDVTVTHHRISETKPEVVGQPAATVPAVTVQVPNPSPGETKDAPPAKMVSLTESSLTGESTQASAKLADPAVGIAGMKVTSEALKSATKGQPFINSLGMKFVPLSDSKFSGRRLLFGSHEVRQKDFAAYLKAESLEASGVPAQPAAADPKATPSDLLLHPVVNVNLRDARNFCAWLSYRDGVTYRLPTDHEWSLALGGVARDEDPSRAASEKNNKLVGAFIWGGGSAKIPRGAGNFADRRTKQARVEGFAEKPMQQGIFDYYEDGFAWTAQTMMFEPNEVGLYDMAGNAWEWCIDQAAPDAEKQPLRGGSWLSAYPSELGASTRLMTDQGRRDPSFGFRCVIDVD
jgi:formylglycine-generating enzyme required for sulfatase activity